MAERQRGSTSTALRPRALGAVLIVAFAIVSPVEVGAQGSTDPPSIQLVEQSDWVTGGSPFNIAVRVNGSVVTEETELVLTVFDALPNRSQFQQTLQDKNLGTSVILERSSLDESLGPDGVVRVQLPVQDQKARRYYLKNAGVYPVKVELRSIGSSESFDRFTTHLINVPAAPQQTNRLQVAPILPVRSPYTDTARDPLAIADDGASIRAVAAAMGQYPEMPLSLDVATETLERARDSAGATAALDILSGTRNGRSVLPMPWVPLGSPMFAAELSTERNRQFHRGMTALTGRFGAINPETVLSTARIDPEALAAHRERGARRIIVSNSSLTAAPRGTTLARPFALSTGRSSATIPAMQLDQELSAHFLDPEGPTLGAHRLLADLAVIYNDRPGQERGIVVAAPNRWVPDEAFLSIYLRGLNTGPQLVASSADALFELPPEGGGRTGIVRSLAPRPKNALADFGADRINELRRRIDGYTTMVDAADKTLDQLERRLLAAESATLDARERDTAIATTSQAIDRQLGAIRLPSERSIRFTARQGEVPVSVQNDTGTAVRVVVRLSGDRVEFPNGSARTLEVERHQVTERFRADARTSGVFPVQVRLESPDGSIVLARSRILISSTAASGVGVLLSAGAGGFLALWWIRSTIRSRRMRRT